ncbi:MAG: hypothetical protein AAB263_03495, partial [Planctomycetota bacterium]
MKFLICASHSDRRVDLGRCSLNGIQARYESADRLAQVPPFASLASAESFDVYKGGATCWLIDTTDHSATLLTQLKPPWRVQNAILFRDGFCLIGNTRLALFDIHGVQSHEYSDPWLAGGHTVCAIDRRHLALSCSASDAVLVMDADTGSISHRLRLPAKRFGINYPLKPSDDLRQHYIHTDIQLGHLNRASPDGDGFLVSTWIQGCIGLMKNDGSFTEIASGFVGCHGVRRHPHHGLYFSDSCAGHVVFLTDDGKVRRRIDCGSRWLHDAEIIGDDMLVCAPGDQNRILLFDLGIGRWIGGLDVGEFGASVQFLSCAAVDSVAPDFLRSGSGKPRDFQAIDPQLLNQIGFKEDAVVDLQKEVSLRDTLLSQSQASIQLEVERVKKLQEEVALRDRLLTQTQQSLQGESAKILALQREVAERDRLLAKTQSGVQAEAARLEAVQAEVAKRDRLLAENQQTLQAEAAKTTQLQSEVAKRDRLLAENQSVLRAESERAQKIQSEVVARDRLLTEGQKTLKAETAKLAALQAEIAKRDRLLVENQQTLQAEAAKTTQLQS